MRTLWKIHFPAEMSHLPRMGLSWMMAFLLLIRLELYQLTLFPCSSTPKNGSTKVIDRFEWFIIPGFTSLAHFVKHFQLSNCLFRLLLSFEEADDYDHPKLVDSDDDSPETSGVGGLQIAFWIEDSVQLRLQTPPEAAVGRAAALQVLNARRAHRLHCGSAAKNSVTFRSSENGESG